MTENERLLKQERNRLDHLVNEALHNGAAGGKALETQSEFSMRCEALQSEAVQSQSRKVDDLVLVVESEKAK